jgi:polyribonucleotide nucleotidyltransferase
MEKRFEYDLAGRKLIVTTGKTAEQANGSCLVQYGDTVVMVNAVASSKPREGIDFFPLSVDFEEKLYAVGKIPGSFIKREARPSEKAILTSRLIDRPLRPLFPEGFRNDVQIVATVLSIDPEVTPDFVAMIGSSIALSISDIPFTGPTGSVLVGYIDNKIVINPTVEQMTNSDLHLIVSGTKEAVLMVEAGANEISEAVMLEAIMTGHEAIKGICEFIESIKAEIGVEPMEYSIFEPAEDILTEMTEKYKEELHKVVLIKEKAARNQATGELKEKIFDYFNEKYEDREKEIKECFDVMLKKVVRHLIVDDGIRPDHRVFDEIRPISCDVSLLPRTHGSGMFKRGQTQVLTIATLGSMGEAQKLDGLDETTEKRYMHHYNFPSYSVGETGPNRGPKRREIGHGALAERALVPVIPSGEEFPYTIRLVSEVLSSNGSSSQASVCGSTLSLLDAGVPIKKPVAGIAMGLIKDEKVAILSDIQGLEDHLGDMDFKVAGTKDGITAIQMDIKIAGIDRAILKEALERALKGRLFILGKMLDVISEPREELSPYAPRMLTLKIHPDKIRTVIGSGGKTINKIIDETGVKIDIDDVGMVFISSPDLANAEKAKGIIEDIVSEPEMGKTYNGKVTRIMKFGAFVEFMNGKEGMVHISKLAKERVNKVEDVVNIGDSVIVKVIEIDDQGRVNLIRVVPKEK